jgi:hypothetical protein
MGVETATRAARRDMNRTAQPGSTSGRKTTSGTPLIQAATATGTLA